MICHRRPSCGPDTLTQRAAGCGAYVGAGPGRGAGRGSVGGHGAVSPAGCDCGGQLGADFGNASAVHHPGGRRGRGCAGGGGHGAA